MLKISNLLEERKEQLIVQEQNDKILENIISSCPREVAEFCMFERKLNRILSSRTDGVYNPISIIQKTVENIQVTQKDIDQFREHVFDCNSLRRYNNLFKDKISKYQLLNDKV